MAIARRLTVGLRILIPTLPVITLFVWLGALFIPETAPVARGTVHAFDGGCIDCHGQPGQALPAAPDCGVSNPAQPHPHFEGDCRDIQAYFEAVRLKRTFTHRASSNNHNRLLKGEVLARRYNCFQCHGELGQGGFSNPGALKGYIPGYFGADFTALTRGGRIDSVRSWISQGLDHALVENRVSGPFARFFIERQEVSMPRFGTLPELEIQLLAEYVIALNEFGPMTATDVRAYAEATMQ